MIENLTLCFVAFVCIISQKYLGEDMKTNDILEMIENDSKISITNLTANMIDIPMQVSKYQALFVEESKLLKSIELTIEKEYKNLYDYYLGYAPDDVYKNKPLNRKVLKAEVESYINSDQAMFEHKRQYETQKIKVDLIESYLKSLTQRVFLCKNIIEWEKYKNGER